MVSVLGLEIQLAGHAVQSFFDFRDHGVPATLRSLDFDGVYGVVLIEKDLRLAGSFKRTVRVILVFAYCITLST